MVVQEEVVEMKEKEAEVVDEVKQQNKTLKILMMQQPF